MKISNFLSMCAFTCLFLTNIGHAETIKVGLEPTLEPFEYYDKQTNELTGFDVELIKAIFQNQGYNISFESMTFDTLIPSLITQEIDVAISTITITNDRRKRVDFSVPYYYSGLSVLINHKDKEKIKDSTDLENQTICAQIGTTGSYYAQEIKNSTVIEDVNYLDSINNLQTGRCIAAINDKPVNDYYLAQTGNNNLIVLPNTLTSESYAIAVVKGNEKILDVINKGISDLKQSGQYQQIYDKYFKCK